MNSYRPDLPEHERDEIKRVINKHSGNQISSPRNHRGSQKLTKNNIEQGTFGPNVQRVLMLTDIVTSPHAQMSMNYPEFGIYWPRMPNTSQSSNQQKNNSKVQQKVPGHFPMTQAVGQQQTSISMPNKQSEADQLKQNASRPKSKEEDKDNMIQLGGKGQQQNSNSTQMQNNQQNKDQGAHLKQSNYTVTTAAASVSSFLPIHAVENFYFPMIREQ